jgi:hypothetical protein
MERGGDRSADQRAADREARERARIAREQGLPLEEEDEPREREGGWRGPDLRSMSRYGGGIDVYTRRRLIAIAGVIVVIVLLFVLLGGC